VQVVVQPEEKHRASMDAVAAIAVTGTVTLELALAAVPMVTTYVADRSQVAASEKYKVRFAALPNILLDEPLIPEFTGLEVDPLAVAASVRRLLDDSDEIDAQRAGYTRIRAAMKTGQAEAPLTDAVDRLLSYFRLLRGT
jgi:lipid-A-disaccharide synthase